jgi:hypothetical protein
LSGRILPTIAVAVIATYSGQYVAMTLVPPTWAAQAWTPPPNASPSSGPFSLASSPRAR